MVEPGRRGRACQLRVVFVGETIPALSPKATRVRFEEALPRFVAEEDDDLFDLLKPVRDRRL